MEGRPVPAAAGRRQASDGETDSDLFRGSYRELTRINRPMAPGCGTVGSTGERRVSSASDRQSLAGAVETTAMSDSAHPAAPAEVHALAGAGRPGGPPQGPQRRSVGGREAGSLAPWQVRRLRGFVEAHLGRRLSVVDLAGEARLSRSHFSRAFRNSFGLPPHAYLTQRRLVRAMSMLRETTEPLAQIAVSCGCADQAHLSRLFRDATGCPPREWRRRQASA